MSQLQLACVAELSGSTTVVHLYCPLSRKDSVGLVVDGEPQRKMPSALPWVVDSASRMTNLSSFMAAQPSCAHPSTDSVDEFASINGESFGTPDTKSERSRYYDADSGTVVESFSQIEYSWGTNS